MDVDTVCDFGSKHKAILKTSQSPRARYEELIALHNACKNEWMRTVYARQIERIKGQFNGFPPPEN